MVGTGDTGGEGEGGVTASVEAMRGRAEDYGLSLARLAGGA